MVNTDNGDYIIVIKCISGVIMINTDEWLRMKIPHDNFDGRTKLIMGTTKGLPTLRSTAGLGTLASHW